MATVISSVGTISNITANSIQRKVVFDGTRYWTFYMKSETSNTLFYAYSTTLTSWTESSVSLGTGIASQGSAIDVLWDSANSLVLVSYFRSTDGGYNQYMRGVISGTTITWGSSNLSIQEAATSALYSVTCLCKDSSGYVVAAFDASSNPGVYVSVNVLSASFAEDIWGNINSGGFSDSGNYIKGKIFPLASRNLLSLHTEDGSTNIRSIVWTSGSSWGGEVAALAVSTYRSCWDAVLISTSSIFVLSQTGASTFGLVQTTNQGTSYTSKTAPSWPSSGLATNSQVALCTDGTDLYAVCIRGDSSCSVAYNKYTVGSDSWGGWTDVETGGTQTRAYINAQWLNARLVILYGQVNGSNYDLTVTNYGAATWAANQDTNLTAVAGTKRLRFILNATGDPSPIIPQFEYRYKPVLSTIAEIATQRVTGRSNYGAGSIDLTMPSNVSAGNTVIVGFGTYAGSTGGSLYITKQSGTATIGTITVYSANFHSTQEFEGIAVIPVTGAGSLVIRIAATNAQVGATATEFSGIASSSFLRSDGGSTYVASSTTPSVSSTASIGDLVLGFLFNETGNSTLTSGSGYTQIGEEEDWTNYISYNFQYKVATSVDPAVNWTLGTAQDTYIYRISLKPSGGSFGSWAALSDATTQARLKSSSYIDSGGAQATTYQLTPPAGKVTSDFEAGCITDDTNPLASFNPSSEKYSEWEVCVEAVSGVVATGDEIEFRMTNNGVALDSYSYTPKWTIGTSGSRRTTFAMPMFFRA
jgi:hypothetical protein